MIIVKNQTCMHNCSGVKLELSGERSLVTCREVFFSDFYYNFTYFILDFRFDRSDLPLLVAIAGTHTPNFPLVVLS